MPIKRRVAKQRREGLSPEGEAILLGRETPLTRLGSDGSWHAFWLRHELLADEPAAIGKSLRGEWDAGAEDLVAEWVQEHPGTRPPGWWWYAAPRWADNPKMPEPRRLLSREGARDTWPGSYHLLRDCDLGLSEHADYDDTRQPVLVESEAAYLARHGLFLPGERKRLRGVDFEPVVIVLEVPEPEPVPRLAQVGPGDTPH